MCVALPILTIAFDNVRYSANPEKWDMHVLLEVAMFLGIIGAVASFVILYIGLNVFNLSVPELQSFIYLKLSVRGHLVLRVARTKGSFWSVKPAPQLLWPSLSPSSPPPSGSIRHPASAAAMGLSGAHLGPGVAAFLITDVLNVRPYRSLMGKGKVASGLLPPV